MEIERQSIPDAPSNPLSIPQVALCGFLGVIIPWHPVAEVMSLSNGP